MDLENYLSTIGSTNIEEDKKTINFLCSTKIEKRLERVAKCISNRYNMDLKIVLGGGCKCVPTKQQRMMVFIDPLTSFCPGISKELCYLRMVGSVAHESGHILYSDFNEVGKVNKICETYHRSIPILASTVNEKEIENPISEENKKLYDAIRGYIVEKNIIVMQNSLEDGAIEHRVPSEAPKYYGGIVALRNWVVEKEEECLKKHHPNYQSEDKNIFEYFMIEIRHMATIGYRREKTSTLFLEDALSKEQIKEVEMLALYSRLCTKNTAERTAISELIMEYFDTYFDSKALEFYQNYMNTLSMSADDLMNAMDMEMNGHTECAIQGQLDPSLAGSTKPQNMSNDYSMDMPEKLQDKINEKMKERQEQEQEESESGSQGDSESNSSQSTSDSSNDNNTSEANSSDDKSKEESENGDGQDGEGSCEKDASDEKNDANQETESSESGSSLGENSESGVQSSANDKKLNKHAEQLDADRAFKEELKNNKEAFKKEKASNFKNAIQEGKGKAPQLSNGLGDINSISDIHKGVRTKYYSSKEINSVSYTGSKVEHDIPKLLKISNQFSKKLKEVLMYRAKCKRKTALKRGNINEGDLYRIVTDTKVFKDTIPGVVNKARICALIDLSGSMSGEKAVDAISASYMLADACQRIKVPISILGHNTSGNACSLYHFIEFEKSMNKNAKDKLLCAETCSGNHDSLAIFHSLTDLVRHKKKNENLIFIVISDGAPAGIGNYWGDAADEDIKRIYKSFEKNYGTQTIGIGIGDDVSHVPNIYDNYLLVPNVEKLGGELLKLLKKTLM